MSKQPCAIVGIGQTKHKKRRDDVSLPGLVREAAQRALDDAELTWTDIDAVVLGKAPDPFEGVMMPELSMADALGAAGKPMLRVHTAGSVGGSTALVASHLIADRPSRPRAHRRVREAVRGQRPVGPRRRSQRRHGRGRHLRPVDAVLHRQHSGAPEHIGWKVAVKDRRNAAKNPYAHLQMPDLTIEDVKDSPMLWEPDPLPRVVPVVRRRVRARAHERGRRPKRSSKPPAWVLGSAMRSELGMFPGRDPVRPQAGVECAHVVLRRRGRHEPARADRHGRALRAVQLVRADVARRPRHLLARGGVEDDRRRRDQPRRQASR